MDFIDIVLARALTPQGQIDAYAARAQKAVQDANAAVTTINEISDNLDTITATTTANNEASAEALADAQAAAELLADALEDLDGYLSEKFTFQSQNSEDLDKYGVNLLITYPDETQDTVPTAYYYKTTGNAVNGSMTQQAITNALSNLQTTISAYVDEQIAQIPSGGGGGDIHFDAPAGSIVIVGADGKATAGSVTQDDIIRTEILAGAYGENDVISLTVDYQNLSITRTPDNINFDTFKMFGGRKRCIVNNAGTIVAWYGDNNYIEDGSLGQVMVYQPKFYYLRAPLKFENGEILKENISLSANKKSGFSVHPMFLDAQNHELEYVLLPAYEGCAYSVSGGTYNKTDTQNVNFAADMLSSIAEAKPITGTSQQFTITAAEQMATNRGTGWLLTDLAFESLQQMLMIVEYNSLNLQAAFDLGPTNLNSYSNINGACLTGSTSALGSTSGRAASTTQTIGASSYTNTAAGKCSISYRGVENPYGNTWRMVGQTRVMRDAITNNTKIKYNNNFINIPLATGRNWLSNFGYDSNYSWAILPKSTQNGTSNYPIGDYNYGITIGGDTVNGLRIGGMGLDKDNAGPFCFAYDHDENYIRYTSNARIMHIPTYNSSAYTANIASWKTITGGAFDD